LGNIEFAWDRRKPRSNLAKHGVAFKEPQPMFPDENARLIDDPARSKDEERFVLLGYSFEARDGAGSRSALETPMRSEYDLSTSRKNPYAKQLKRQITIRIDVTAVNYFKNLGAELGMPYQNLINMFLRDCAIEKRRPVIQWPQDPPKRAARR
jgi:uncharacterized protein (DUF4415 family)